MEKNVCGVDRLARAILGVSLLSLLLRSRKQTTDSRTISVSQILAVYVLAELSVNVFAQWCPLNALLGINTCRQH